MSKRRMYNLEDFIELGNEIHGGKYDYSKATYTKSKDLITITCPIHGDFLTRSANHINSKQGCKECGYDKISKNGRMTTEEFIEKARLFHGDLYDYSKSVYEVSHKKVIVICPEHGEYQLAARDHLRRGCPTCGNATKAQHMKLTQKDIIRKGVEQHGDKFDYSRVEYKGLYEYITLGCPEHGWIKQKASDHIYGYGCRKCATARSTGCYSLEVAEREYAATTPATLYHVEILSPYGRTFEKVGITVQDIETRFHMIGRHGFELLRTIRVCEGMLREMIYLEHIIKESLIEGGRAYKVHDFKHFKGIGGWTECFLPITKKGET